MLRETVLNKTQIAYTVAPKYLYRDYFKAKVYLGTWTLRER